MLCLPEAGRGFLFACSRSRRSIRGIGALFRFSLRSIFSLLLLRPPDIRVLKNQLLRRRRGGASRCPTVCIRRRRWRYTFLRADLFQRWPEYRRWPRTRLGPRAPWFFRGF